MHNTAMVFIQTALSCHPVQEKSILEVGSYNVNGSIRDWVEKERPASYFGVDLQPQTRYVDETLSASDLIERFGRDAFDVVICAELLEHAEDWRATVRNLKGVLKVGGLLVLTCRGPGFPRHDFPGDYWRFTTDQMRRIFSDSEIIALLSDPEPGVLLAARKANRPETDISTIAVSAVC
jgi:SAM-dependent methyltransferase